MIHKAHFSIEDVVGPYEGYTSGQTWNGWACPYFTADVARRVMEQWNTTEYSSIFAAYDSATDTYTFHDTENETEPYSVHGEQHAVDGQQETLYPIGNGVWCWEQE